jgi:hypothetical protein
VKLYRVMKVDVDGKPLVGTKRNMLGVRPTDPTNTDRNRVFDVPAVSDIDPVGPGKGLSTAPKSDGLKPRAGEALFEVESDDLPGELAPNQDKANHCLIQPSQTMTLGEYQQALAETRDLWKQVP